MYILLTIVKLLLIYLVYRLYKYLRRYYKNHGHEGNSITNCITFNYCKRSNKVQSPNPVIVTYDSVDTKVETNEPGSEERLPRRRPRFANLKTNAD